jgi:hypothetical protein
MTKTADDRRAIWETYAAAWKATTVESKLAAIAESVSPACTYRDPTSQREGHAQLLEHMVEFHAQVPGGHFETKYFLAHHDRSIARWNMLSASGDVLGEGISYGEYGADGKLLTMTGFFETP